MSSINQPDAAAVATVEWQEALAETPAQFQTGLAKWKQQVIAGNLKVIFKPVGDAMVAVYQEIEGDSSCH